MTHDCEEHAVERGSGPNRAGTVWVWLECLRCRRTWGHHLDSVA